MDAADKNDLLNDVIQMANKKLLRKYELNNFPLPNTIIQKSAFIRRIRKNPRLRYFVQLQVLVREIRQKLQSHQLDLFPGDFVVFQIGECIIDRIHKRENDHEAESGRSIRCNPTRWRIGREALTWWGFF